MKQLKNLALMGLLAATLAKPDHAAPTPGAKPIAGKPSEAKGSEVKPSQVLILGEVKAPGAYLFAGPHRLVDAIVTAGGVTADPRSLRLDVQRDGKSLSVDLPKLIDADTGPYIKLQAGDVIVVKVADAVAGSTVPHIWTWLLPHPPSEAKKLPPQGQYQFNGMTIHIMPLSQGAKSRAEQN